MVYFIKRLLKVGAIYGINSATCCNYTRQIQIMHFIKVFVRLYISIEKMIILINFGIRENREYTSYSKDIFE